MQQAVSDIAKVASSSWINTHLRYNDCILCMTCEWPMTCSSYLYRFPVPICIATLPFWTIATVTTDFHRACFLLRNSRWPKLCIPLRMRCTSCQDDCCESYCFDGRNVRDGNPAVYQVTIWFTNCVYADSVLHLSFLGVLCSECVCPVCPSLSRKLLNRSGLNLILG